MNTKININEQGLLNPDLALGPVGLEVKNELETYFLELNEKRDGPKNIVAKIVGDNHMDLANLIWLTHVPMATSVSAGYGYVELADKLGKDIAKHYNLKIVDQHRVRLGAFMIDAFVRLKYVVPKLVNFKSNNKGQKTVWMLYATGLGRGKLLKLRKEFPKVDHSSYTLENQANPWENGFGKNKHGETIQLIRGVDYQTARKVNASETPLLLNAINKKQAIEYKICNRTYDIFDWAYKSKQAVFDFLHNKFMKAEARESKIAQAEMLLDLAGDVLEGKENKFFQRYFCDFRGRIYPESKYLNEIGTDLAKGLLKLNAGKPLGENGRNYLYHHIANCWGEDKVSHAAKVKFVEEHYEEFVNYGLAPKAYPKWQTEADAPFQFLNACFELADLDNWISQGNKVEDFVSHTICYFDGSNNGAQWLFALARDAKHSHLVNVIKSPDGTFGDFYAHVGSRVFDKIKEMNVTQEQKDNFENYLMPMFKMRSDLFDIRNLMFKTKGSKAALEKEEEALLEKLSKFQADNKEALKSTNVLYWQNAINEGHINKSEFRTLVKRPCMTFAYSGTVRGFAQQILDDSDQFDNKYLQNKQFSACFMLAEMIYGTIEEDFPELVAIRNYLTEVAGAYVDANKKNLEFRTILSNFPFTNGYFKHKKSVIKFKFYTLDEDFNLVYDEHKLNYETDTQVVDKRKGKLGISPNFVHQLDSLHLQLVINDCPFDIVSAHDSYGCLPADAEALNKSIRSCMVRVLEADPIGSLSEVTGHLVPLPKTGDLDINEIHHSEFAFA